ncbi:MAG: hypothetical protein QOI93_5427 [Rhodospirillaceae bacterium]|nr:hypothetical protein [Rhodospirillaceae bacterium]
MQHFASSRWYKYQPGQRYPERLDLAAWRGRPGAGCGLFPYGTTNTRTNSIRMPSER